MIYPENDIREIPKSEKISGADKGKSMELKEATYKSTELGLIPEDWELKELKYLLRSKPSYGINAPAVDYKDHLPQYLRITDISEEGLYLKNGKVSVKHSQSNSYKLEQGDIVFARTGASVGKTYLYDHKDGELVYAGFLIKVTPDPEKLNPKLLFAYTRTQPYWNWVKVMSMRSGQPGINGNEYGSLKIPLPPTLEEQKAIATALSDVDTLITNLDKLIAKKKAIKQGAMQRLLKSPAQGGQRLPGFEGEWRETTIGEVAKISTGSRNTQDRVDGGKYPFFVRSQTVERINTYSFEGEGILTAGDGVGTGKVFHYVNEKIDIHQRVYLLSEFKKSIDGYFLFLIFKENFYDRIMSMTAKSSVDSVRREMIADMKIQIPPTKDEQRAIACILSDMDKEIESLETKKSKYLHIKQGMMQELLTGKTRLNH